MNTIAFVRNQFYSASKAEFGDSFSLTAGTEGNPLSGEFWTRLREKGVHASDSTPALVVGLTDDLQDYLAGLDSEALLGAMKKLRRILRTLWEARLRLPYDGYIRGAEVHLTRLR
jgi:hypothetical protein